MYHLPNLLNLIFKILHTISQYKSSVERGQTTSQAPLIGTATLHGLGHETLPKDMFFGRTRGLPSNLFSLMAALSHMLFDIIQSICMRCLSLQHWPLPVVGKNKLHQDMNMTSGLSLLDEVEFDKYWHEYFQETCVQQSCSKHAQFKC